jgi:HD-like signal output (HDOD) protein
MLELNERIKTQLERCNNLPSLPAVAVQILDLAQNSASTMGQVANVVSFDPALVTKLLKIANSSLYGQRRHSSNVRQAVMLLGLDSTLMLTLSFSLIPSLREQESRGIDYVHFWKRSLLSSTAAHLLAARTQKVSPEDAFLASLLQDIGMVAIDKGLNDFYTSLDYDKHCHEATIEFERSEIESDHAVVGAWLLDQWNFPNHLVEAVESSHQDTCSQSISDITSLTDCVALSSRIADGLIAAYEAQETQTTAPSQWLSSDFEELLEDLCKEIPVIESLFDMNLLEGSSSEILGKV